MPNNSAYVFQNIFVIDSENQKCG